MLYRAFGPYLEATNRTLISVMYAVHQMFAEGSQSASAIETIMVRALDEGRANFPGSGPEDGAPMNSEQLSDVIMVASSIVARESGKVCVSSCAERWPRTRCPTKDFLARTDGCRCLERMDADVATKWVPMSRGRWVSMSVRETAAAGW
jgi:hypothetical protein